MHSRKLVAALLGAAILVAGGLGAWASGPAGAAAAPETSGLTAARFELTIDGHSLAVFQELVGIVSQVDGAGADLGLVTKGEDNILKPPGKRSPPTITLRRAMTRNIEMAAWHELVILGDLDAAAKNVSVTAFNKRGDPVARYHLTNAWPSKVEITAESSAAGGVMQETVTLVSEFMQRVSV
jgi:phage tail-like protein